MDLISEIDEKVGEKAEKRKKKAKKEIKIKAYPYESLTNRNNKPRKNSSDNAYLLPLFDAERRDSSCELQFRADSSSPQRREIIKTPRKLPKVPAGMRRINSEEHSSSNKNSHLNVSSELRKETGVHTLKSQHKNGDDVDSFTRQAFEASRRSGSKLREQPVTPLK